MTDFLTPAANGVEGVPLWGDQRDAWIPEVLTTYRSNCSAEVWELSRDSGSPTALVKGRVDCPGHGPWGSGVVSARPPGYWRIEEALIPIGVSQMDTRAPQASCPTGALS